MGVGEGDEVIIPGLTYFAIPAMVPLRKAKPVFADIGLSTHVLDPKAFEAAITERTKVVVPTHLFGTPCDMEAICAIAKKHNIKVIEDCAQSTGARFGEKRVGSWGDAAYYTFGLTKNITTLSGAMITTDDDQIATSIRKEIEEGGYGSRKKMAKETLTGLAMFVLPFSAVLGDGSSGCGGEHARKDPIHERFGEAERTYDEVPGTQRARESTCCTGRSGMKQLSRIEELNGARQKNGKALDEALVGITGLTVPSYPAGAEPIYMSFVVHHPDRNALAEGLRARGVDTTTGYMNDMSDHPLFQEYKRSCPNATEANANLLHIPVHPNLSVLDRNHLIQAVQEVCSELA